jgi:hypothetical protein
VTRALYFAANAPATSGSSGGTRHHRPHAREIPRVEISVEHHPERSGTRLTVFGRCRRTAGPAVDRESLEQRDPAPVEHRLEHAEQPAEMRQWRIHDHHAFAETELGALVRLVVLRPLHDPLEHRVAEVDARGPVVPLVSIRTATPGNTG